MAATVDLTSSTIGVVHVAVYSIHQHFAKLVPFAMFEAVTSIVLCTQVCRLFVDSVF
jgi:hypothetical protein